MRRASPRAKKREKARHGRIVFSREPIVGRRPRIFLASSSEATPVLNGLSTLVEEAGGTPLRWPDAFPVGRFVLESLIESSRQVDGALIIASADDRSTVRGRRLWIPRDNVLFELGVFVSALSTTRTALAAVTDRDREVKLPSDLGGLVHLVYDPAEPAENRRRIHEWMARFFVSPTETQTRLPSPPGGRYNWSDTVRGLEHIRHQMECDGWIPDVVVGLGRSGGVVGGLLASFLGSIPFRVLDVKYRKPSNVLEVDFRRPLLDLPRRMKRALVIEGATTGGTTPRRAKALLESRLPGIELRFAFLIQSVQSAFRGHYYAYLESGPIAPLPWHGPLSRTFLTPGAEGEKERASTSI